MSRQTAVFSLLGFAIAGGRRIEAGSVMTVSLILVGFQRIITSGEHDFL